jgi:hypothetical protein
VLRGNTGSADRDPYGVFWDETNQTWVFAVNTGGDDATLGADLALRVASLRASGLTASRYVVTNSTKDLASQLGVPWADVTGVAAASPTFAAVTSTGLLTAGSVRITGISTAGIGHYDASGNVSSSLVVDSDIAAAAAIAISKLGNASGVTNDLMRWNGTNWVRLATGTGSQVLKAGTTWATIAFSEVTGTVALTQLPGIPASQLTDGKFGSTLIQTNNVIALELGGKFVLTSLPYANGGGLKNATLMWQAELETDGPTPGIITFKPSDLGLSGIAGLDVTYRVMGIRTDGVFIAQQEVQATYALSGGMPTQQGTNTKSTVKPASPGAGYDATSAANTTNVDLTLTPPSATPAGTKIEWGVLVRLVQRSGAIAFKPTNIAGCKLWLAADRDVVLSGTTVATWADQSGNGNHWATTQGAPAISTAGFGGQVGIVMPINATMAAITAASVWKFLHDGTGVTVVLVYRMIASGPGFNNSILATNTSITSTPSLVILHNDNAATPYIRNFIGNGTVATEISTPTGSTPAAQNRAYIFRNKSGGSPVISGLVDDVEKLSTAAPGSYSSADPPVSVRSIGGGGASGQGFILRDIIIYNQEVTGADLIDLQAYADGRRDGTL